MTRIQLITEIDAARAAWESAIRPEKVTDLWDFRMCFHKQYGRELLFVTAEEDDGRVSGLLPLSWVSEIGYYGIFPGEVWHGKTWLEQNQLPVRDEAMLEAMLSQVPGPYHLRYLSESAAAGAIVNQEIDETGYLFVPPQYGYDADGWRKEFSKKSRRRLRQLVAEIEEGTTVRLDEKGDFDAMVALNQRSIGEHSYFADARFTESFRSMMEYLDGQGWLRMTTVVRGDEPIAVDLGCVYQGTYTLLGGGTHPDYAGVAKYINHYHIERSCRERLESADFLCGDFCWKPLFHLTPRPLYLLAHLAPEALSSTYTYDLPEPIEI